MFTPLLASFLLATATPAFAQLNKTYLFPDGLGDHFVFGDTLPVTSSTTADIDVPDVCTTYAAETNSDGSAYCSGTMSAINVTYTDCDIPWTMCRCDNAENSFDTMVSQFGRLPVNLRDYVRYIISFDGSESAFSYTQDMVLFGDESTEQGLTVLIHEAGHDIDQGTTESSAWTDAVNADSCSTDPYGDTSLQEEFAQMNVISLYIDLTGGANGTDTSCISNQLGVFSGSDTLDAAAMSITTCDESVRSSVTGFGTEQASKLDKTSIPKPTSMEDILRPYRLRRRSGMPAVPEKRRFAADRT